METMQKILLGFTIVGAINWGLVGLFNFNLVTYLLGSDTLLTTIVYTLVGVCGLINIGIYMAHFVYKD